MGNEVCGSCGRAAGCPYDGTIDLLHDVVINGHNGKDGLLTRVTTSEGKVDDLHLAVHGDGSDDNPGLVGHVRRYRGMLQLIAIEIPIVMAILSYILKRQ